MGFRVPDDLDLNDPPADGQYHFVISEVDTSPVDKDNVAIDGIELFIEVVEGTVRHDGKCTQIKRQMRQTFRFGNASHKDGGLFCDKCLARIGIATGILSIADRGKEVDPDWSDLQGRDFIAVVHTKAAQGGYKAKTELQPLRYWHVSDPEVSAVPKCQKTREFVDMIHKGKAKAPAANGNGGAKKLDTSVI